MWSECQVAAVSTQGPISASALRNLISLGSSTFAVFVLLIWTRMSNVFYVCSRWIVEFKIERRAKIFFVIERFLQCRF